MMDLIISMLSAVDPATAAAPAQAADMEAPASVWGVIVVNLMAAIPPTVAALTAMVIAIRNSRKQDVAAIKQDQAKAVAEEAVKVASVAAEEAEAVAARATAAVQEVKKITAQVGSIADAATVRLSTAAEDAQRTAEAVTAVLDEIKRTHNDLCESIKINRSIIEQALSEIKKNGVEIQKSRPVEARIVAAGEKKKKDKRGKPE